MNVQNAQTWQSVQKEVLRRIHAREWKPGDLIPNEAELAKEFGCARPTVNRALRTLAEGGWPGTSKTAARATDTNWRFVKCASRQLT